MKILLYPDQILRQKAAKIVFNGTKDWGEVANEMVKTMRESGGVGLSGPQVGISSRIIVITSGYESFSVFLNPEIIIPNGARNISDIEGCLSLPGITGKVARPHIVMVYYQDIAGNNHKFLANGLVSRIILHEYDHLNGVLFPDKMSKKNFKEIEPKLKELENITSNEPQPTS